MKSKIMDQIQPGSNKKSYELFKISRPIDRDN